MTKDKARDILTFQFNSGLLPYYDVVIYREVDQINGVILEYTFRGLLCIAYDLKLNEDEN